MYTGQSPGARLYRLCTLVRALPSHRTTVLSLSVVEYMCTHSHPRGRTVPEEASQPVIIYDRSLHRLGQWLVINITYNTVNNRKGILAWVSVLQLYAHRNQEDYKIISEERNDVLPLQWSVNNRQKWKELQVHVPNSISCLCIFRNTIWRKTTNELVT